MDGWAGNILDVDLSSGRVEIKPLDEHLRRQYLGGRGINSRLLYDNVKPGTEAASPGNVLIFGAGPLGGTIAPAANRLSVTAKPFSYNGVGTSNAGGKFAPELKYAGYDHLLIRGKAAEPVYLWIDDDQVELRPARHLWGKTTWETDQTIRRELGDQEIKVAAIGPAGENMVWFACIMVNMYRAAGKTGMGAVMGSKNLKAVAVRGTKSITVAQPKVLKSLTQEITRRITKNDFYPFFSVHGTPATITMDNERGALCIKNYQESGPWQGLTNFSPEAISAYYTNDKACYSCPIHCSHFFEVKEGPYKGEKGGGLEAGHLMPFGTQVGNTDLASVFKCLNLANQYGIDTLETGFMISGAMECYEKGIISQKDADGLALEWGNPDVIIAMIHKIAKREGLGNLLAEGVHGFRKLGKGAADYLSYCKGTPLGSDDTRLMRGHVLCQVTGTIPAHHEEGVPGIERFPHLPERLKPRFGEEILDPLSYNKAPVTIFYQNLCTVMDALEICKFASGWCYQEIYLKEAAELFTAATGMEMDAEALELAGERIHDLERAFAVREGMTRQDDRLHGKVTKEPIQTGSYKGEMTDLVKFEVMLDDYYELRGWDKETGIPRRAKLEQVGLEDVACELERMGKLPLEKLKNNFRGTGGRRGGK